MFRRAYALIMLGIFLFTACDTAIITPLPSPTPTLPLLTTLRATATLAPGSFITPIPPTPTFTPEPTPTPVIHVVEEGDTLFGVAIEYGVRLDALQQANGIEDAAYLRIGQGLIIPLEEEGEPLDTQMAVPVSNLLLPTPTPLPLVTSGVNLYETPVGGIWCMGEVINTTESPVTNIQVQATLLSPDDVALASGIVLAAADYLAPGKRAPFAILFHEPVLGAADVRVDLLRGEAVSEITAGFTPLVLRELEGAVSGPQYRVSGVVLNNSETLLDRVIIVVTLYDGEERVIGYRQAVLDMNSPLTPGASKTFRLLLTPQGLEAPHTFQVLAWGSRVE